MEARVSLLIASAVIVENQEISLKLTDQIIEILPNVIIH